MSKKHRKQLKQFKKQMDVLKGSLSGTFAQLDELIQQLPQEQQESLIDVRNAVESAVADSDLDQLNDATVKASEL